MSNATQEQDTLNDQELINAAAKTAEADQTPEIDYSKIDYLKLDPTKIPHHIVQSTPAFAGLLGETQQHRQKVSDLTEANEVLVAELQNRDKTEEQDENEPITRGEFRKTLKVELTEQEKKRQKEQIVTQQNQRTERMNQSCLKLEEEVTTKTAGEGLDAQTVIGEGVRWLSVHKPRLLRAAYDSEEPARELYELATKYVPSILKRVDTRKNSQLLDSIQKSRISKGGGAFPAGQQKSALLDLLQMSDEQMMVEIEKEELAEE